MLNASCSYCSVSTRCNFINRYLFFIDSPPNMHSLRKFYSWFLLLKSNHFSIASFHFFSRRKQFNQIQYKTNSFCRVLLNFFCVTDDATAKTTNVMWKILYAYRLNTLRFHSMTFHILLDQRQSSMHICADTDGDRVCMISESLKFSETRFRCVTKSTLSQ